MYIYFWSCSLVPHEASLSSDKHLKLNIPNELTEPHTLGAAMAAGEPGSVK